MRNIGMAALAALALAGPASADDKLGVFDISRDIGAVKHAGSATFDQARDLYRVTGSGKNMWFGEDAFHFVCTRAQGDIALAATIEFEAAKADSDPHRKAVLMVRQSLDPDSAYADVAVHGDGLTSLQFRTEKGANTHEVQANIKGPKRVRIERRGRYVRLFVGSDDKETKFSGAAVRIDFEGPVYFGLGVCSHKEDVSETATFSNVDCRINAFARGAKTTLYSTLETQAMGSTDRRVVMVTPGRIEAPNFLRDGKALVYNSGGKLYRVDAEGGKPEAIDTGFADRINNDHGVSPDGKLLAISDQSQGKRQSLIYTLPSTGGAPRLVTPNGPSYWHGWSPDGKTLAYCAQRDGEFDIYTIPAEGGDEKRLTTAKGLDDGPEYSPDGKHIYFNSERSGRMQIWRMKADGSEQEAVTDDEFNNWFPHPSPDGKSLVFLSYEKDVTGHPENKDVTLRRMALPGGKIDVLGRFFGGQGTINVPCWSPDSRRIAFVTYQLIPG